MDAKVGTVNQIRTFRRDQRTFLCGAVAGFPRLTLLRIDEPAQVVPICLSRAGVSVRGLVRCYPRTGRGPSVHSPVADLPLSALGRGNRARTRALPIVADVLGAGDGLILVIVHRL